MLNQVLQIWCNGVLDTGSIRSSFAISPSLNGTMSVHYGSTEFWFGPTGGWRSGVTYSVTIGPTLRAQAGGTLGSPYNFSFRADPFRVTQTVPSSGQTNVLRNTMIQVSLSARLDPGTVQTAFDMTPNVAGSFTTFSNADYFNFYPSSSLSANTMYTVIIGTSLRSFAGDSLALPYSFPFTTGP
jgi:hypothetical protein